jgi:hypothetical protein
MTALTLVVATAWPALAWACPACAGSDTRNQMFLKVGAFFVLAPFLVVGLVLYVLRQAPENLTKNQALNPPPAPRS